MAKSRESSEHRDLEWLHPNRPSKGRDSITLPTIADEECSPPASPTISPRTIGSDDYL